MFTVKQNELGYASQVSMRRGTEAGTTNGQLRFDCPITVLDFGLHITFDHNGVPLNPLPVEGLFTGVRFYKVVMDDFTIGDIMLHNIETFLTPDPTVAKSIVGLNVLNQLDVSIVGNIREMRIRPAVGDNVDRIHYIAGSYLKRLDKLRYLPDIMKEIPKDYAGDEDAIRDLVRHIAVTKGIL